MHLSDLKKAVFDDDGPAKAAPAAPAPHPQTLSPAPIAAPTSAPVVTDMAADHSDDAYQRLAARSDFLSTSVFQAINKYLAPMASLAIDDKTKFNIAIKQAQAQDGLDPAAVNAVFEQCKKTLNDLSAQFAQNVANKTASDVDAKKKQAEDLQAQVQQLTEDAFAAKQRIDTAQHKFEVALQTRLNEITQEQSKYASLLA
jgi:hypothetical protein